MPFLMKDQNSWKEESLKWQEEYRPSPPFSYGLDRTGLPASLTQTQRPLCGNADCANGWKMPWRNRRRPIFQDQWGCSGRCVLAMVRAALRRAAGNEAETVPHRHRVPLGLLMLAQGWITHPQLRQALQAQQQNGTGRIGEWLISECGLDADQITRGLSMQWNCPVLGTEGFSPETMALVMPHIFIEKFRLLPLRIAGMRILYLGFEDGLDASASLALEQMTELKVESGILSEIQFRAATERLLQCDGVEVKIEAASDTDTLAGKITAILEQKRPLASRLVRLHQYYWLRLWLESGTAGKAGTLPVSREDMSDYVFTVGPQTDQYLPRDERC